LGTNEPADDSSRERILVAAEELFAESGFEATPTSRIADRANVPKGLVHYYFRRKADLLVALIDRLPDEHLDVAATVVPGDVAASLRALVAVLDARLESSRLLSHLLWREADTHEAVRRPAEPLPKRRRPDPGGHRQGTRRGPIDNGDRRCRHGQRGRATRVGGQLPALGRPARREHDQYRPGDRLHRRRAGPGHGMTGR
jgi:AcrR family transcriptional regulator